MGVTLSAILWLAFATAAIAEPSPPEVPQLGQVSRDSVSMPMSAVRAGGSAH